jgi:hypothetical protein
MLSVSYAVDRQAKLPQLNEDSAEIADGRQMGRPTSTSEPIRTLSRGTRLKGACQLGNEAFYCRNVRKADEPATSQSGLALVKLLTDGAEKDLVLGFCYAVISRHAEQWPPKEQVLAEEFVNWLGVNSCFVRQELLTELCRSEGVSLSFVRGRVSERLSNAFG